MWYQSDTVTIVAMTLRTDDELDAALAELAELEGVSKQEAARRAILEKAARAGRQERVSAIADEMLDRWGDVLDRLSRT